MNCTLNSSLCAVTADAVSFFLFPGGAATHGGTIRKMWIIRGGGGVRRGGGQGFSKKCGLLEGGKKKPRELNLPTRNDPNECVKRESRNIEFGFGFELDFKFENG